jgi:hypothetical protein
MGHGGGAGGTVKQSLQQCSVFVARRFAAAISILLDDFLHLVKRPPALE